MNPYRDIRALLFSAVLAFGVSLSPGAIPNTVTFTNAFVNNGTGVTFSRPVFFAEIPGRDSNYVVLEQQRGNAIIVHRRNGAWVKDTLVKIPVVSNQNEMGFLGLAFHPNFSVNHRYFVFYSKSFVGSSADCAIRDCGVNVVEERQTDSTLIKDAGTAPREIIRITKSAMNHDGGEIGFGPTDGYLYISVGDGGDPQGDPVSNAPPIGRGQKTDTLLGKFLRIDVNATSAGKQYAIPSDNPFVSNSAYLPEIWALGVRNPWRWSFDLPTGNLWAGEVGNASYEEIDTVVKGANLGWRLMEGYKCQPTVTCSPTGLTLPVFAYPHSGSSDTTGTAVIGGYVYRANPLSPYYGLYFFGDNGNGRVWVMRTSAGHIQEYVTLHPTPTSTAAAVPGLSAFGMDSHGSLYAMGITNGVINRLNSPDLVATSVWKTAKPLAPIYGKLPAGTFYDFQGRKTSHEGSGVYFLRRKDGVALVPVFL